VSASGAAVADSARDLLDGIGCSVRAQVQRALVDA
jgi:hypothetical protein